ncbi:erythromycin esterase family protein [Halobaculum sp. MBLA0147]|uniref:erythromycin esterase family protein n=1 Tax=Halobaculum sp. MBLA0147 TaxID=3079934 RepID=UPI0035233CB9
MTDHTTDDGTDATDDRRDATDDETDATTTETTRSNDVEPDTTEDVDPDTEIGERVLRGLADHVTPLETTDPTAPRDDLDAFPESVLDAQIVGLGEATHGTREFFQFKDRLIRHLVADRGVRLVCLEANAPETLALNRYVVHGEGDPAAGLAGVYFWTWQVEAVRDLLEWLRSFNEGRPVADRVRFHGLDVQYTAGAVDRLERLLETVAPETCEELADDLATLHDDGERVDEADHSDAREAALARVRDRLGGAADTDSCLSDPDGDWAAATSDPDAMAATDLHLCLETLGGAVEYKRRVADWRAARESVDSTDDADDGRADESDDDRAAESNHESAEAAAMAALLGTRDEVMADLVDTMLDRTGAERAVIWGHDAHVNRDRSGLRDRDLSGTSLGSELADRYGQDYRAVGFAWGHGAFQAIGPSALAPDGSESGTTVSGSQDDGSDDGAGESEDGPSLDHDLAVWETDGPPANSLDAALAAAGHDVSVLDVRGAAGDERVRDWLDTPQRHRSVGATYDPREPETYVVTYPYPDAFDAVVFVDETTAARPLDGRD